MPLTEPLTDAQTRTLAAMKAENGGTISHVYAGHVMTRDARIIPCTDPEYRGRTADPTCLNIETDDDPADHIEQVKLTDAVPAVKDAKGKTVEAAKPATFETKRTKQKNDSDLHAEPTVDIHAPK